MAANTGTGATRSTSPADRLAPTVGRTPLIEIKYRHAGRAGRVFAKYESLNFTGSIKDRMALQCLAEGYRSGQLRPGCGIAEASSGNTAISFAAMGRALGHTVDIYMPAWMSAERKSILRGLGATLHEVTAAEGGFLGSIARAEAAAIASPTTFLPRQFSSQANVRAHAEGTGPEIIAQLASIGLKPHAFVAGVGTGGTVMGVSRALREIAPQVFVHPVEPAESPILTHGHKVGSHRIQGISDEFVPDIVDLGALDAPIAISDGDAIIIAQRLASELGLAVGISSGANLAAAVRTQQALGSDTTVATVFADSNKKYLSTDLFAKEPLRDDHVAAALELIEWRSHPCPSLG